MATTRKILSKGIVKSISSPLLQKKDVVPKKETDKNVTREVEMRSPESGENGERYPQIRSKKICQFCSNKTEPHYFDMVALHRFINDRGRIVARARSGTCAKHQRRTTREVKRARHLALHPFTVKV